MVEDNAAVRSQLAEVQQALKIAKARLAELEPRSPDKMLPTFHTVLDNMIEGCQIIGFDWRYLYVNDTAARYGRQAKEELLGSTVMERYPGIDNTEMFAFLQRCMDERVAQDAEYEFTYPDGSKAWIEFRVRPVAEGIFIQTLDVTKQHQSEQYIRKANRTRAVLSRVNDAIVRIRDINALFDNICQIAIEEGGFRMAWVGRVAPESNQPQIVSYAHAASDSVDRLVATLHNSFESQGLITARLRAGEHCICNQIKPNQIKPNQIECNEDEQDSDIELWRSEALQLGYRAFAILPLMLANEVRGTLHLYSDEPDFFDEHQVKLLDEIAANLSLVMNSADQEEKRRQAQEALRASEARYRSIVEDQTELVCRYDRNCRLTYVNRAYAELYKKRPEELIGASFLELIPEDKREAAQAYVWSMGTQDPITTYEHTSMVPDGSQRWYQWTDRALANEHGEIVEYQGVGRDITKRKQAEAELERHTQTLEEMRHFLQTALDAFPANASILDPDGTIITVNAPWIKFSNGNGGIAPTHYVGNNYLSICDNASGAMSAEAALAATGIRAVIAGRQAEFNLEYPCNSPTADRWFMLRVLPFAEPPPRRVLLAHIDITEQEKAERAEREQRLIAETLRDSLAVLTSSLDFETVVQFILAYSANIIPSDAGAIILFEGNQGRVAYTRGFSAEAEAYYEHNMISLDSGTFSKEQLDIKSYLAADTNFTPNWIVYPYAEWIQSSIGVPIVLNGKSVGLLTADSKTPNHFQHKDVENLLAFAGYAALALENAQNFDQLEQRVNERTAELQAAKERVEAILNNSADGILLVDSDFTIQQTNVAFHRLFACQPDECHNQPLVALLAEKDDDFIAQTFPAGVTENQATTIEIRARRRDGTAFDAELSIGSIKDGGWVCNIRDITERKSRERQLRLYASLQENVSDGVITSDLAFKIQSWNKAAEQIYGWRAEQAIGKTIEEVLHINFQSDEERQRLSQELVTQGHWKSEVTQPRQDGAELHLLTSVTLLKDEKNVPFGFVSVVHDITERKRAEEALTESEERFRQIAENIDQILFVRSGDDQQMLYVNPRYEDMLEMSRERLYENSLSFIERVYPDDLDYLQQQFSTKQYVDEGLADFEFRIIPPQQGLRWIRIHTFPIKGDDGAIVRRAGVAEDITERKNSEAALQANEEKYRHLVETMQGGLAIYDIDGKVSYVNDRAGEILGYSRQEIIGSRIYDFVDSVTVDSVTGDKEKLQFFQRNLEGAPYELTAKHKSGKDVHLLISGSPLVDKSGNYNGSFVVMTDITTQKQAEEALRQALAKEKELGELKTRFVSMASHEFRTPLATILATTETLTAYRHKMTDAQIEKRLHNIFEQIGHLKSIMEDMLQLARIQARRVEFNPVLLNIDALCRSVIDEFREGSAVSPRLIYHCEDSSREIMLDKKLMRQILSNLISNALKYSDPDSEVRLSLAYVQDQLILTVSDKGVGIPEADMKHLFEPFHRGVNVGTVPGTGLGLTIVKEAVDLHNGEIKLTSEEDLGTSVTVRIPVRL